MHLWERVVKLHRHLLHEGFLVEIYSVIQVPPLHRNNPFWKRPICIKIVLGITLQLRTKLTQRGLPHSFFILCWFSWHVAHRIWCEVSATTQLESAVCVVSILIVWVKQSMTLILDHYLNRREHVAKTAIIGGLTCNISELSPEVSTVMQTLSMRSYKA